MPQSYTNILVHIVFSTKERQPWLDESVRHQLFQFLGGGIKYHGGIPLEINGTIDHVHILAKIRQDIALSDLVRDIKARSSGWIKEVFPALSMFAWQKGYGAFSVSLSEAPKVRHYILNQEEHHRTASFGDEFVRLLQAHEIEYDERYLLE